MFSVKDELIVWNDVNRRKSSIIGGSDVRWVMTDDASIPKITVVIMLKCCKNLL